MPFFQDVSHPASAPDAEGRFLCPPNPFAESPGLLVALEQAFTRSSEPSGKGGGVGFRRPASETDLSQTITRFAMPRIVHTRLPGSTAAQGCLQESPQWPFSTPPYFQSAGDSLPESSHRA